MCFTDSYQSYKRLRSYLNYFSIIENNYSQQYTQSILSRDSVLIFGQYRGVAGGLHRHVKRTKVRDT